MQRTSISIAGAFLLLTFFTFIVYLSAGNNVPSDSLGMVHQQLIAIRNLQILALLINSFAICKTLLVLFLT